MKKVLNKAFRSQAVRNGYNKVAVACFAASLVCQDALAQSSTKGTLVNVFNWIYGLVGVTGAIALLGQFVNAKLGNFLNLQDPRKGIVSTLIYTAGALSVVAIIQAIKYMVGGGGGDVGSL